MPSTVGVMMRSMTWLSAMLSQKAVSLEPRAAMRAATRNLEGGQQKRRAVGPTLIMDLIAILGFAGNIGFSSRVARAKSGAARPAGSCEFPHKIVKATTEYVILIIYFGWIVRHLAWARHRFPRP